MIYTFQNNSACWVKLYVINCRAAHLWLTLEKEMVPKSCKSSRGHSL